jgi:Na+/melibiose symporter-like transporter
MLTEMERRPLKHMRGAKEILVTGILLFLAGSGLMVFGGDERAVLSVVAMAVGAGLGVVSAYYWGCDNVSCSPRDL